MYQIDFSIARAVVEDEVNNLALETTTYGGTLYWLRGWTMYAVQAFSSGADGSPHHVCLILDRNRVMHEVMVDDLTLVKYHFVRLVNKHENLEFTVNRIAEWELVPDNPNVIGRLQINGYCADLFYREFDNWHPYRMLVFDPQGNEVLNVIAKDCKDALRTYLKHIMGLK